MKISPSNLNSSIGSVVGRRVWKCERLLKNGGLEVREKKKSGKSLSGCRCSKSTNTIITAITVRLSIPVRNPA